MDLDDDNEAAPTGAVSNLADLVTAHAATDGDAVAVVEPLADRSLTWARLEQAVSGVAAGLAAEGLVAGQRLGLVGRNSIDFVVAYLAALRAGLVAVPLHPDAPAQTLQQMVDRSGARLVLSQHSVPLPVPQLPLTADGLDALRAEGHSPVVSPPDPEALAVLLFTAGTSGEDRPAMVSHRALVAHLRHVEPLGIVDRETVALGLLPFCHVFGLNAVLGGWVYGGGRLVVLPEYPPSLSAVVAAQSVTNIPLSPVMLYRLLTEEGVADALSGVRTVISGAAPLPWHLAQQFTEKTGLRVEQGYGLTEAAPGVTATLGGPILGPGHVGRPLPGVEIRIGDGDGAELVEPSEPGEIWVRGDNLFSGYWPDGQGGPGEDGWFGTGDIGYLVDGELFLVDRAAELIMVHGFHVYPAEVEQAISELPGVRAVAVVGQPDERSGEQIVAFVEAQGVDAATVQAHCAARIARFKRPAEVRLVDELPRGLTGKVRKGVLRDMLTGGSR